MAPRADPQPTTTPTPTARPDAAAWTVHPDHIRAALNTDGHTLGINPTTGTVLADTEDHLRTAGAQVLAWPEHLTALFTARGVLGAAAVLTRRATLTRASLHAVGALR